MLGIRHPRKKQSRNGAMEENNGWFNLNVIRYPTVAGNSIHIHYPCCLRLEILK